VVCNPQHLAELSLPARPGMAMSATLLHHAAVRRLCFFLAFALTLSLPLSEEVHIMLMASSCCYTLVSMMSPISCVVWLVPGWLPCLRTVNISWYMTNHPVQLSLPSPRVRSVEYWPVWLGVKMGPVYLCWVKAKVCWVLTDVLWEICQC